MAHAFLSNRVVTPQGTRPAALLTDDGIIEAICRPSEIPSDAILHDYGNLAILPGLVDTALIPNNKRLDRGAMLSTAEVAHAVMQIVNSPASSCPVEVTLEPQLDPERVR